MTPNNIVNMASILGFDIIALTDHNSCKNTPATVKVGNALGVLVIPGMELCTSEEAHVICLFNSVEGAMEFDSYVSKHIPNIKNKEKVFGEQLILNENDECIGDEKRLLIAASFIGVDEVAELTKGYGGTVFPAHIDKSSYSIVASLGVLPVDAGFTVAEITSACNLQQFTAKHPEIIGMPILTNSDAHYLENMREPKAWLSLTEKSREAVISAINSGKMESFSSFSN